MLETGKHGSAHVIGTDQQPHCGSFGYLFPDSESPAFTSDTPDQLRALQMEIYTHGDVDDVNNSALPPVFTYFGQFIDHDITNQGLTSEAAKDVVDIFSRPNDDFSPQPRNTVVDAIKNQRTGRLDLDSLYGPELPTNNPALDKLTGLLRFKGDRAKMWIAFPAPSAEGIPGGLPLDGAADLLRLGRLMAPKTGDVLFTQADFDDLPDGIRTSLLSKDGTPNMRAAVIGDPRNDENLFVAQFHLAFLRFHNRMVDALRDGGHAGNADEVFNDARKQVILHYQWLVMHVYLPSICDPVALQQVKQSGASLYGSFLEKCDHETGSAFPMPIEFAAGAYRFGHSMVRGNYDWNAAFGRGESALLDRASFEFMFLFTGGGENPLAGQDNLPQNWVADWRRVAMPNSEFADRTTRRMDTNLALPLQKMRNEATDLDPATATPQQLDEKNLAARNLKRSARMNVPSAQACIDVLNSDHKFNLRPLTKAELTSGRTGNELINAGYDAQTPLWFYVLKEAEVRQAGQRLGAVGTHIVAGTIAGLLIHDPQSVWNTPGSFEERWHPIDGVRASGQLVDSIPAMLRAALLLEA